MKDLFWMFVGCSWYAIPMGMLLAVQPLADLPQPPVPLASLPPPPGERTVSQPAIPFSQQPQRVSPEVRQGGGRSTFHAGHACPNCGTLQYQISGRLPGGFHTHTCYRCGTTWFH